MLHVNAAVFLRRVASLHQSEDGRRGIRNAAYNTADSLLSPMLMIVAAPFLVSRLGWEQYGIWMLANALLGTLGVLPIGLADATVKYVSSYRARTGPSAVTRVIRSALTVSGLLGGLLGAVVVRSAPLLVSSVFKVGDDNSIVAIRAIQLAGLGLLVRSVDSVFLSTLKGYERYDLAAQVGMAVKIATIGLAVMLAALGYGVVEILVSTVIVTALGTGAEAILSRHLVGGLSLWPLVDRAMLREVFGFGMYSWVQGLGGVIFSQVDRLLVGAILGSGPLAYYAISAQLAQQIHALPTAALSFIFPLISYRVEHSGRKGLRELFPQLVFVNILSAALLAFPLIVFARPILSLWMGGDFANRFSLLLAILAVAYALLAANVVPHNVLLGLGHVRFVSMTNLAGGILSAIGVAALVPVLGIYGAGLARLLYGLTISMNYLKVKRSL